MTTPVKDSGMPTLKCPSYDIGGITYISLNSLLNAYNLDYQWDGLAKRLTITDGNKAVTFGIGSNIAIVEGADKVMEAPVVMRRSMVVVPRSFASYILSEVYAKEAAGTQRARIVPAKISGYSISRIVLDAGHGGKDPGAIGQGLVEKEVTLDIVKRVKRYLEGSGIEAILTRDSDVFVSLWKRADIANKQNADFFISIHANAAPSAYAKGFEVFYLSEAVDDSARAIAAAENASLRYESSSFADKRPSTALEAILRDIEYTEARAESRELAEYIASSATSDLGTKDRGVKGARFYVLKGADMPAILIEVGFVSNRQDAVRLKNSSYREELAKAIARGILGYSKEYEKTEGFTR